MLAGCRGKVAPYVPTPSPQPAPVETKVERPVDLMPLEAGNQWSYNLRTESYQGDKQMNATEYPVAYRVVAPRANGGWLVQLVQDDQVIDRQVWRSSSNALFQDTAADRATDTIRDVAFVPPQPLAVLPLQTGQTFSWSGRGVMPDGLISQGHAESKVLEPQTVDTAMGTLSAIPIRTVTTYPRGSTEITSWFKPGVGLVRYRQETSDPKTGRRAVLLLVLTNYALKR